jgi:hypothetical protein
MSQALELGLLAIPVALKVKVQGHDAALETCFKTGFPSELPKVKPEGQLKRKW